MTGPNKKELTGSRILSILSNWKYIVWPCLAALYLLQLSMSGGGDATDNGVSTPFVRKGIIKGPSTTIAKRPFGMPLEGEKYKIFQPILDMKDLDPPLFSSAKDFIRLFKNRLSWVNTMVQNPPEESDELYAKLMYIDMMKSVVSGTIFGERERSISARLGSGKKIANPFNIEQRKKGLDFAYLGDTMTGYARLDNVRDLLTDVMENNVEGGYIETGVWRGGSSIFARAVLAAHEQTDRISYVCDSFAGLPPGDRSLDTGDKNWDNTPYLEVASEIVASSFSKYGVLDHNVVFAKGFFNETMPVLAKKVDKLAIMRLDGDMYESTVDVLYQLYDKLSIGGYVIMDDWTGFPSKIACEDFFEVHKIQPDIIKIDQLAAYWKKTEEVEIQHWRYEQNKFKGGDVQN